MHGILPLLIENLLVQIWCKMISNTINDTPRSPTKYDSFSHDIQRYPRFQTGSDKTNDRAITPSADWEFTHLQRRLPPAVFFFCTCAPFQWTPRRLQFVVSGILRWFHCHCETSAHTGRGNPSSTGKIATSHHVAALLVVLAIDTRVRTTINESTRRGWPPDIPPVCTMDAACTAGRRGRRPLRSIGKLSDGRPNVAPTGSVDPLFHHANIRKGLHPLPSARTVRSRRRTHGRDTQNTYADDAAYTM